MRGKAARHRGAGSRRKGRIEAIDVEGEIDGTITEYALHLGGDLIKGHRVYPIGIKNIHAVGALAMIGGANAELKRAARLNQAIADGIVEHGAVIDAPSLIRLDIAMGVEMKERQGPIFFGMGFEQRIGN